MRSLLFCAALVGASLPAFAADLRGRVVSDLRGVIGATVSAVPFENGFETALRENRGAPQPSAIVSTTTGVNGAFRLVVPPEAPPFVVRASFGGLATRTVDGIFEGAEGEDLGEVTMLRADSITGRVVDPAGRPVAGALVRLGRDGVSTTTSKEGLFRFEDLPGRAGGPFVGTSQALSVDAAGFEVQEVQARGSSPLIVKLKASSAVFSGSLKDPSGRPAGGAVVRVVGEGVTRWVLTDAAGRFKIGGVKPRQGRLQAMARDGGSVDVVIAPNDQTFSLARPSTIEGRVTRSDSARALPGVKVAARASGVSLVVRTGADGRYRLVGVPRGTYRISFDDPRYVALTRRNVEIEQGALKTLDIALTPAVTLVGRVTDEKGRPVAGARGSLSTSSESRMGMMLRLGGSEGGQTSAFTSGPDGSFKATRLAPGPNQRLTVTHVDYERRVIPGIDLPIDAPRPTTLDIVLSQGLVISGVVRDKEGQPVPSASIVMNRQFQMSGGRGGNSMTFSTIESVRPQSETDFDGRFEFRGLSAGEYDVIVSKPGFTRSTSSAVKAGDGSTPLDITLMPGAAISGRLIQTNGLPVAGYSVMARPSGTGASQRSGMVMMGGSPSQSDPEGAFVIDGLTPGTAYDISVFGAGEMRPEPKKRGVVAPSDAVDIEVATRGRIAGRVIDAASAAPITDFEVSYAPARSGNMQIVIRGGFGGDNDRATPFSSADGTFALEGVPPGNWDVTVRAKTYQTARTAAVTVVSGETKTIEVKALRGLAIRGRVVDARSSRPIQDATVTSRDGSSSPAFVFDMGGVGGSDSLTDAEGRFEIANLGSGSYQVTARHSSYSEGSGRVTIEDKDGFLEIALSSGGSIAGIVTSSRGGAIAGAEVSLQSESGEEGFGVRGGMFGGRGALTDATGRFRFDHLSAGRYKVSAALRNESSAAVDVPLNAGDIREDIRLHLDAGATVRGVVSGLPESARAGIMVGAQGAQDYFASARTNPDGTFEFSGVPRGTLTLRASAGDFMNEMRTATKEIVVEEGQLDVQTEIVFEEGLSISGTVTKRGVPVPGARVNAFMMGGGGRMSSGRSDENGSFRVSGLEPGRYMVMAMLENVSGQASQTVDLQRDTSFDLVIPTARFGGTVVDGANSLPLESQIEVQRATPAPGGVPSGRYVVSTDSSGRFGFEDLEPIEYRLTARRSGYEAVTRMVTPTDAGEDLRIELKRGSGLAIEARDAQMGFGLRSVFVRLQQGTNDAFTGSVVLDGEGKGEIPGVAAGSYTLFAQASGYAPLRIPNVMAPAAAARLLFTPGGDLELQTTEEFLAGGPKSGTITSLSGAPTMGNPFGPTGFRLSRLSHRFENLAPGKYQLTLDGGIVKTFDIAEGGVTTVRIP